MNDTDWHARALEVAGTIICSIDENKAAEAILAFAQAYAAEVTAEVERLKTNLGAATKEHDYAVSDVMRLRAQLAAAGPVKVPDKLSLPPLYADEPPVSERYMGKVHGWNDCRAEVLRLNAAPPKENV